MYADITFSRDRYGPGQQADGADGEDRRRLSPVGEVQGRPERGDRDRGAGGAGSADLVCRV